MKCQRADLFETFASSMKIPSNVTHFGWKSHKNATHFGWKSHKMRRVLFQGIGSWLPYWWDLAACHLHGWPMTSIRPVQFSWWMYYSLHFDQHQIGAICILRSHYDSAKLTFTANITCPYNIYANAYCQSLWYWKGKSCSHVFINWERGKKWSYYEKRFWMSKDKIKHISEICQINIL